MADKPETVVIPRLLDRARMAAALCLSEDTLDNLRKQGCPFLTVPGTNKLLFDPDEVVIWIKDQNRRAEPETLTMETAHKKAIALFG